LLEESWSELFMLTALQWSLSIKNEGNDDRNPLLLSIDSNNNQDLYYSKNKMTLVEIITKFKNLNINNNEFGLLKAIVLFKSGKLLSSKKKKKQLNCLY
jgi:hypothetical protein